MGTKGQQTRDHILKTAEDIILQRGYSGTSIEDIIGTAGITKGGFFYHFRGKADLARELMRHYLAEDEALFTALIERADALVEDPLQRALLFLKLFAEAMADLPGVHPGCLVASFTYESQLFDPEVRALAAAGVERWREVFAERFRPVLERYTPRTELSLETLADALSATLEGGIILSRVMRDPQILVDQVLQFRTHVRLLFGDLD